MCAQEGDGHSEETNAYKEEDETNVHKRDGYSRENTVQKGGQTESAVLCQKETARKKTLFSKRNVY